MSSEHAEGIWSVERSSEQLDTSIAIEALTYLKERGNVDKTFALFLWYPTTSILKERDKVKWESELELKTTFAETLMMSWQQMYVEYVSWLNDSHNSTQYLQKWYEMCVHGVDIYTDLCQRFPDNVNLKNELLRAKKQIKEFQTIIEFSEQLKIWERLVQKWNAAWIFWKYTIASFFYTKAIDTYAKVSDMMPEGDDETHGMLLNNELQKTQNHAEELMQEKTAYETYKWSSRALKKEIKQAKKNELDEDILDSLDASYAWVCSVYMKRRWSAFAVKSNIHVKYKQQINELRETYNSQQQEQRILEQEQSLENEVPTSDLPEVDPLQTETYPREEIWWNEIGEETLWEIQDVKSERYHGEPISVDELSQDMRWQKDIFEDITGNSLNSEQPKEFLHHPFFEKICWKIRQIYDLKEQFSWVSVDDKQLMEERTPQLLDAFWTPHMRKVINYKIDQEQQLYERMETVADEHNISGEDLVTQLEERTQQTELSVDQAVIIDSIVNIWTDNIYENPFLYSHEKDLIVLARKQKALEDIVQDFW